MAGRLVRRRAALRRLLPGRRVGREAREVLGQQRRWHHGAAGGHAGRGCAAARLLLHGRHVRRARAGSHRRVRADEAHQSVRRLEARRRPHDHRRGGGPRAGRGLAALLQRRGRVRGVRRAPRPRVASDSAGPSSGAGQAGGHLRLRRRLPDAGRHLCARLHPRRRPGRGPPAGRGGRRPGRAPHLQPGQRQRLLRPRGRRDRAAGDGPSDPRDHGPAPGRRPGGPGRVGRHRPREAGLEPVPRGPRGHRVGRVEFAQRRAGQ